MGAVRRQGVRSEQERLSTVLDALSHPRRRRLVGRLSDDAQLGLSQEGHEEARSTVTEPQHIEEAIHDDVVELRHVHLPRLDDAGIVDWRPASGEIRPGPAFDVGRRLLEAIHDGFQGEV